MVRDDESFSDGVLTEKQPGTARGNGKCISDVIGVRHVAQQWYHISNRVLYGNAARYG